MLAGLPWSCSSSLTSHSACLGSLTGIPTAKYKFIIEGITLECSCLPWQSLLDWELLVFESLALSRGPCSSGSILSSCLWTECLNVCLAVLFLMRRLWICFRRIMVYMPLCSGGNVHELWFCFFGLKIPLHLKIITDAKEPLCVWINICGLRN